MLIHGKFEVYLQNTLIHHSKGYWFNLSLLNINVNKALGKIMHTLGTYVILWCDVFCVSTSHTHFSSSMSNLHLSRLKEYRRMVSNSVGIIQRSERNRVIWMLCRIITKWLMLPLVIRIHQQATYSNFQEKSNQPKQMYLLSM